MKTICKLIHTGLVLFLIMSACEPFEKVSDIPEIHFKSYEPYQLDTIGIIIDAGKLVFTFQDGNADFGLDTVINPLDTINFFMVPFGKTDGIYDSIDANIYGRKYAIYRNDRLDRTGQNKTVRGEIELQIYYFIPPPFDTIRYDFYIVDRAGNQSNVESTSDIAF